MIKHQREFLDWLTDTYALAPKLTGERRHSRVEFVHHGKPYSIPIASSPSDPNADRVRRRHITQLLGPPPPPLPQQTKRTLTELTKMAEVSAFRNPPRILPAQTPNAVVAVFKGTAAQYPNRIRFGIPQTIAAFFDDSGVVVVRGRDDHSWIITKTSGTHPAHIRYQEKEGHRLEISSRPSADHPLFGASPAEFVINGQQVLVTIKEKRAFTPKPRRNEKPPAPTVTFEPSKAEDIPKSYLLPRFNNPVEAKMRTILEEIRALEQQTTYRLRRIGDEKRWAWVAPTIE